MTEATLLSLLALVGVAITALLGYLAAQQAKAANRQRALEQRIHLLEQRDRRSWLYIRSLIDYAYRHSDTQRFPLPEPPSGWLEDEEKDNQ